MLAGGDKYNHKWELAIVGLLKSSDLQGAAEFTGVSVNTLLRWLQQEEFQDNYKQAKQETLKQAISQLQSATGEAVTVLREVAKDVTVSPSARVSASKAILDGAIKVTELHDMEERLINLEKQLKEKG